MLPYGKQIIDQADIDAVVETLRGDFITTGPTVSAFEAEFAKFADAEFAVAVSNGTAALHAACHAAGIGPGDQVIVPPMTFAASANCVLYCGGMPVFADVDPGTLLLDPAQVEAKITPQTKAVIAVDYAGQPCDYDAIREITNKHGLTLIADACHALGAEYKGKMAGTLADMTCFSFHPVKHLTTGEGGMILTDSAKFADAMRRFRNHGITTDYRQREEQGSWFYEMTDLGMNYRITDFQCALGISQLRKQPVWLKRRREIAAAYDELFANFADISPLAKRSELNHAYHLYVVRVPAEKRGEIFSGMREAGIGVNVHYIPVHFHPYYRGNLGTKPGMCPVAENAYEQIISLPMFPGMTDEDTARVVETLKELI